tara:strand:+ start:671 stop:1996 length:1326 start_codon:yes stop_codon:yes gene_type:complete
MNKSVLAGFAVGTVLSALAVFAFQSDGFDSSAQAADDGTFRQLDLFGEVFDRVRADYVEPTEDSKLIETAINGMLTALDPHSSYMNPKNYRDMQVQTRGEFGGLGIEVTMENGVVKVVTPIDDTPASRAGLRPNDYITHIDTKPILGMTLSDAVDKMRGPVDTPILLTIVRKGADEPFDVKLNRAIITIKSVKYHREGDIGYVRITTFNEQVGDLLDEAIHTLQKQIGPNKVKGYILDLRNNPGGLLDQAINVSGDFIEEGEIVSTRGRHSEDTQRYNARGGDLTKGKSVIVLVNGGSASASEIVAGAIQDHRRGIILGTRSFGKGSVQTIIPLGADGAMRLTTARYYTPSGHSIQAKGIEPDIIVEQNPDPKSKKRMMITGEAELPGHLAVEDGSSEVAGSDSYVPADKKDDKQLLYAIDLLNGVKKNAAFKGNSTAQAN